ncbi:MAG: hypothetical protein AB7F50_08715 [Fimbriimonadaceae bacterium]
MTTVGKGILGLLLLAGVRASEQADRGKDTIVLNPSGPREMVDRNGKPRIIAVPTRAQLRKVVAFPEGFLRFDFESEVGGRPGENFWCEVHFGPSTGPGKWDRDVKYAVLVLLSGATGDSELNRWIRPGHAYLWRESAPGLATVPMEASGRSVTVMLGKPIPSGLVIGEASCHWYPELGKQWAEPRYWQTRVTSAALEDDARMKFLIQFPTPKR